jgi:hypothetical protein
LRDLLKVTLGAVAALSAVSLAGMIWLRGRAVAFAFGDAFSAGRTIPAGARRRRRAARGRHAARVFHVASGRAATSSCSAAPGSVRPDRLVPRQRDAGGVVRRRGVVATTAVLAHAAFAACRSLPSAGGVEPRPAGSSARRLSVVLPCHNSGLALGEVLAALDEELRDVDHEIVVVSDGSTDATVEIARAAGVRVIENADRSGKGHALRVGLAEATGEYVAFMDSDGDIHPTAIRPFLTLMSLYEPDIVLGSKRHPLSRVEYPMLRRALSWTYHKVTRVLFRVNVRDTQTGMKLLRA